jgi:hypothetical protein
VVLVFAISVFIVGLLTAMASPRAAALLTIFFVSWNGLDIDFGLRVTVYQLLLLPLLLVTITRAALPGWQPPIVPARTLLLLMVLQTIFWSLVQLGFLPVISVGDSALRGPTARAIVQIFMFLFTVSPVVVIAWSLRGADDAARAFRIYLASLVVLAVLGWCQIIVKYSIDVDPYPIGALNVALGGSSSIGQREGQFAFEALKIYRMNSFAGEPRNLGVALAIGMSALQILALVSPRRPKLGYVALYAFFLITELATFSTSGIGVWLASIAATLPLIWLTRTRIERRTTSLVAVAATVVGLFGVAIIGLEASDVPILDLLNERTIDRVSRDGAIEDFDLAIIDYFRSDPTAIVTGVGLGNAHLYAMPFLDPLFALYAEGAVFVGKSGFIRTISEAGIIGLALLLLWFGRLMQLAAAVRARATPGAAAIAAIPMIAFLLSSLFQSEMYVAAGLLSAILIGAAANRPDKREVVPA